MLPSLATLLAEADVTYAAIGQQLSGELDPPRLQWLIENQEARLRHITHTVTVSHYDAATTLLCLQERRPMWECVQRSSCTCPTTLPPLAIGNNTPCVNTNSHTSSSLLQGLRW